MTPDQQTACSRPYRWPWHGQFAPARTALLVLRDAPFATPDTTTTTRLMNVIRLAADAGVTFGELPGRGGEGIAQDFVPDFTLPRPHYGGFSGTDLDSILRRRRISDLIIAGFPFELGADCTMRQANDLGYECLALSDCCTGLAPDTLAGALSSIQMSGGIFGAVAGTDALLDLLSNFHPGAISAQQSGANL